MKTSALLIIILACLFLFSCGGNTQLQTPILSTPTPTTTFTLTPSPTYTPTLEPTMPPSPTQTPDPTLPESTRQAQATLDAVDEKWGLAPGVGGIWRELSPNGKWAALSDYWSSNSPGLRVVRISGQVKWDVLFTDITEKSFPNHVYPIYWSPDGRYLYVGAFAWMESVMLGGEYLAVSRLDLETGQLVPIILDNGEMNHTYVFGFSSNGVYLAYIEGASPTQVKVRNLLTGNEALFQIPGLDVSGDGSKGSASSIVWSPDQRSFIFSVEKGSFPLTNIIYLVDLSTYQIREYQGISSNLPVLYIPWKWLDNQKVVLQGIDAWNSLWFVFSEKDRVILDSSTGSLLPNSVMRNPAISTPYILATDQVEGFFSNAIPAAGKTRNVSLKTIGIGYQKNASGKLNLVVQIQCNSGQSHCNPTLAREAFVASFLDPTGQPDLMKIFPPDLESFQVLGYDENLNQVQNVTGEWSDLIALMTNKIIPEEFVQKLIYP